MANETITQRSKETQTAIMNEKQVHELLAFCDLPLAQLWDNARDSINGTAEITLKTTVKIFVSAAGCVKAKVKAERESMFIDNKGEKNIKYFPSETDEPIRCDLNPLLMNMEDRKK